MRILASLGIFFGATIIIGVIVVSVSQMAPPSPDAYTTSEPSDTPARRQFTKAEFSREVLDKTKAEIRAEFGSPDRVDEGPDAWVYVTLPIFDEAAGTKMGAEIRFAGLEDDKDFVADVHFF